MPETGHTWRIEFAAQPTEAPMVREWVALRLNHPDAAQVANELFVSVLSTGSPRVEMTLSTAGRRSRITAACSIEMSLRHSHGPGFAIVSALSTLYGLNTDGLGVWAQLTTEVQT